MSVRKRVFVITACIIIAAILIVVCVELFTGDETEGFDGTLVRSGVDIIRLLITYII